MNKHLAVPSNGLNPFKVLPPIDRGQNVGPSREPAPPTIRKPSRVGLHKPSPPTISNSNQVAGLRRRASTIVFQAVSPPLGAASLRLVDQFLPSIQDSFSNPSVGIEVELPRVRLQPMAGCEINFETIYHEQKRLGQPILTGTCFDVFIESNGRIELVQKPWTTSEQPKEAREEISNAISLLQKHCREGLTLEAFCSLCNAQEIGLFVNERLCDANGRPYAEMLKFPVLKTQNFLTAPQVTFGVSLDSVWDVLGTSLVAFPSETSEVDFTRLELEMAAKKIAASFVEMGLLGKKESVSKEMRSFLALLSYSLLTPMASIYHSKASRSNDLDKSFFRLLPKSSLKQLLLDMPEKDRHLLQNPIVMAALCDHISGNILTRVNELGQKNTSGVSTDSDKLPKFSGMLDYFDSVLGTDISKTVEWEDRFVGHRHLSLSQVDLLQCIGVISFDVTQDASGSQQKLWHFSAPGEGRICADTILDAINSHREPTVLARIAKLKLEFSFLKTDKDVAAFLFKRLQLDLCDEARDEHIDEFTTITAEKGHVALELRTTFQMKAGQIHTEFTMAEFQVYVDKLEQKLASMMADSQGSLLRAQMVDFVSVIAQLDREALMQMHDVLIQLKNGESSSDIDTHRMSFILDEPNQKVRDKKLEFALACTEHYRSSFSGRDSGFSSRKGSPV